MLFGGGSKKNKPKILWENPAPNSNFGAQTIPYDFSRIDFQKSEVILKFKRKTTDTKTIDIRLNEGLNEVCVGSSSYFFWRKYTLSKTGLVVDTGGYTSTYPEIKADNSCAIPVELKISGGRLNSLKSLLLRAFSHFLPALKPVRKEVPNMLFGGNKSGGKSSFPGYELKTGVLCSLPALTTNSPDARALSIPAGCIPLCVKVEPEFRANSGKGETSELILTIYDNNNNKYYTCSRNGSGWVSGGTSNVQYLCPLGVYDFDLEAASTINVIYIRAYNSQTNLYSDYKYGRTSVTMWLEKTGISGAKPVKPKEYKRLYLYKDGDQCEDVTGGWVFTKPASPASGYTSSFNKDGCLYCGGQNSGNATFGTVNSINMSDYDRLIVEFHFGGNAGDGNASFYINFNSDNMLKLNIATVAKNKVCLAGTAEMVGGKVNLVVATGGYSTTNMYIKRVWLETVRE